MDASIAQRLAALRRQNGYSQESLAHELGLSRQAISKWERAESSPDTENLIALARLYGIGLDELLQLDVPAGADGADAPEHARQAASDGDGTKAREAPAAGECLDAPVDASAEDETAGSDDGCAAKGCERGPWRTFPYPVLSVILFFVFGWLGSWSHAWVIFLTIPLYYWIATIMDGRRAPHDGSDEGDGDSRLR